MAARYVPSVLSLLASEAPGARYLWTVMKSTCGGRPVSGTVPPMKLTIHVPFALLCAVGGAPIRLPMVSNWCQFASAVATLMLLPPGGRLSGSLNVRIADDGLAIAAAMFGAVRYDVSKKAGTCMLLVGFELSVVGL